MGSLFQDLRLGFRSTRQAPAFALLVVVTLGLGIGATTVVFTAVDGFVLNPFPYPEPGTLVGVGTEFPRLDSDLSYFENLSPAEYEDVRAGSRTLRDVVAWDMGNRQVTIGDRTENLFSGFWWGNAFPTLGMAPQLGRGFLPEEIERGDRVAVLSHRVWRDRFGGDPSLVGGTLLINGEPYTLIGIMPPRTLVYGTELWIPMPVGPEVYPRNRRQFQILARLAPGATLEQANIELRALARRIEQSYAGEHPEYEGWGMVATTWNDINVRTMRPAALVLMGAVGFVLLLVCANVGSLVLARSVGRRRELAVRLALGARRGRLVRLLLTESVVLALLGGLLGVFVAFVGVRAIVSALPALALPVPGDLAVNARVLGFTAVIALASGIAFGVVPALHASRFDIQRLLQSEALSATAGAARLRLQRIFVGVEVALALVLLVGGGLLVNSFLRLQAVEPGFETSNVLTMRLTLAWERHTEESIQAFFRDLADGIRGIPGVTAVGVASQFPPGVFSRSSFWIEGRAQDDEENLPSAFTTLVAPGTLETLGVRVLAGRVFDERDAANAPPVAVINDAAARRYFPGEDPLGRRLKLGGPDEENPWFEVIGVVGDTRNRGLDAASEPELFASTEQLPGAGNQFFILVRTRGDPLGMLGAVREQVRALDPAQPVYAIRTVEQAFSQAAAPRRISTLALTIFALFALGLAGVGIYGVVSYAVTQRTREIGLRIALGAERAAVRRMVVRQALVPVVLGGAAGLAGAIALGRVLSALLFEVSATDPLTITAVAMLLVIIAGLASWLPALRASRLSPVSALRFGRG